MIEVCCAVSLLAASQAVRPAAPDTGMARALAYIDAAVWEALRRDGTPGLALAVVADGEVAAVRTYGLADLASGAPVRADTRFLAGSISKAFTATALLQLEEEGMVDLRRPVSSFLPWFRVRGASAPITLHHLLTHTGGLPGDRGESPSSPYTALVLRDRALAAAPGERFTYSNLGYQLLSLVIEEVEGRPFADAIRTRILEPLGLRHSSAAVTQEGRLTTATGYQFLFDDRPPLPGAPLVPAAWTEYSAGDVNIVTTAPDLGRFLAILLAQGRLGRIRLLQPRSFARMVQRTVPAAELGAEAFYGYGVILDQLEGTPVLWHSGGMPGFRSMLIGDLDEQLGVVLLMNGPGEARELGGYALRALIAARRGREPPPVPVSTPADSIPDGAAFAGRYADSTGRQITLRARGSRLVLEDDGRQWSLLRSGPDAFLVPDTGWSRFPLRALREGNRVVELVHGPRWFRAAEALPAPVRPAPTVWQAYVGHYRAQSPFASNVRVIVRRGVLLLLSAEGFEEPLLPVGREEFRLAGGAGPPERVRFVDVVSGRALGLVLAGSNYYRATSP